MLSLYLENTSHFVSIFFCMKFWHSDSSSSDSAFSLSSYLFSIYSIYCFNFCNFALFLAIFKYNFNHCSLNSFIFIFYILFTSNLLFIFESFVSIIILSSSLSDCKFCILNELIVLSFDTILFISLILLIFAFSMFTIHLYPPFTLSLSFSFLLVC